MSKLYFRKGLVLLTVFSLIVGGLFIAKETVSAAGETITIKKQTASSNGSFEFFGAFSATLSNNETATQAVPPGTYTSIETPQAGWELTSISCTDANSTGNVGTRTATFNIETDESVTCIFTNTPTAVTQFTLTYTAGANGTITGTSPQTVNQGANGTAVTAVPNSGFNFVNWSDASTANPRTDTNVQADKSVIANFAAAPPTPANTVYVDDSNAGMEDGTQANPYNTIQEGVNAVVSAGTVVVAGGTYSEIVTVHKSVTLNGAQVGVNANACSLSGNESVVGTSTGGFVVQANDVTIDGFTISAVTGGLNAGVHIAGTRSGYTVTNNTISNNVMGIYLNGSDGLVEHNCIRNNNVEGPAGGSGIYSDAGLAGTEIQNNMFTGHQGVSVNLIGSEENNVEGVTISNNNMINDGAIYLIGTSGTAISGNTITGSANHGIQLDGGNDNATISGNTITGIDGWSAIRVSNNNGSNGAIDITNNSLKDNVSSSDEFKSYGINSTDSAATVVANLNNLSNNDIGVRYEPSVPPTNTLDATCNWWGNASGPGPVGPGTGSPVTTGVDFTSWLSSDDLSDCVNEPESGGGGGGGSNSGSRSNGNNNNNGQVLGASTGPIEGCGSRTTGFSTTTGESCVGNTGDGCDNRTAGFSTTTGKPCTGGGQAESGDKFIFTLFLKMGPPYHVSTWGPEVKELQKFLNAKGYTCGPVDGLFGPKTDACVKAFQKANPPLVVDGIVGPLTRAVLNK